MALRFDYAEFDGVHPRDTPAREEPTFEQMARRMVIGDVATCVERILQDHDTLGHSHMACNVHVGGMPVERSLRTIEAVGTQVMPAVNAELARRGVVQPRIVQVPGSGATAAG